MAKNFDYFRKQAISLGLSDINEIKKYIREEQAMDMERSLKEIEVNKRIEAEEREKMKRLEIEGEKLKAEIILQEQRLQIEKVEREKKVTN